MAKNETNTRRVSEATGVPYTTLASFVQGGTQSLKGDTEEKIAEALERPTSEIFGGAEPAAPPAAQGQVQSTVGHVISLDELRGFIAEIQKPPPATMAGRSRPISNSVPVVGEVAAGRWLEAAALGLEDITEYLHIDVQGYERARLRAWKVAGPSMNLVYPDGRYVITADPAEAGIRNGDYVIVQRHRADLVEITLKELVVEDGGRIALWPRSNHPDFQSAIYLKTGDEMDQTLPEIVGVVVADYSKRVRPPGGVT